MTLRAAKAASAVRNAEANAPPTTLTKHELPADQAEYTGTTREMEEFLSKTFDAGLDFSLSIR